MLGGSSPAPRADTSRAHRVTASAPCMAALDGAAASASRSWTACLAEGTLASRRGEVAARAHTRHPWACPGNCALVDLVLLCCRLQSRCPPTLAGKNPTALARPFTPATPPHLVVNLQGRDGKRPAAVRLLGGDAEELLRGSIPRVGKGGGWDVGEGAA
jgi:hypothetical protein